MKVSEEFSLIERINERYQTSFRLSGRFKEGENQGAFALINREGTQFVLKYTHKPNWLKWIERARTVTTQLKKASNLVPTYSIAGTFPEGLTFWIQTLLAGMPAQHLNERQIKSLLSFNKLQSGRAVSKEQNWSKYITGVVFRDEAGWYKSLSEYAPATEALAKELEYLVAGKETCCTKTSDIVHGDLTLTNILVKDNQLIGIIDWDAAGCGDRTFDLAILLYYCYSNNQAQQILVNSILELVSFETLQIYLTYAILSQLDWSIRHHSPKDISKLVERSNSIVKFLKAP